MRSSSVVGNTSPPSTRCSSRKPAGAPSSTPARKAGTQLSSCTCSPAISDQKAERGGLRRRVDDHHPPAMGQRHRDLLDRGIEHRIGQQRIAEARADAEALAQGDDLVGEAAMADGDALGGAGGSRGVDDVGEMVGAERAAALVVAERRRRQRRRVVVEAQRRHLGRQVPGQRSGGQHQRRAGIGEQEGEPRRRVAGIERQVAAARLQHRQHRHHQLDRALQREAHHRLGADAETRSAAAPVGSRTIRARHS